jgi:hypothetical protein
MGGDAADGVLFTNDRVGCWRRSASGIERGAAAHLEHEQGEHNLAKPNFGYQKRQKELEKKRKKEEKLKKRQERAAGTPVEGQPPAPETPEPV